MMIMKIKKSLALLGLTLLLIGGGYYILKPRVVLTTKDVVIEVGDSFKADAYIKDLKHTTKKNLIIDTSKLNQHQVGDYPIIYKVKGFKYKLTCHVKDTTAPSFETVQVTTDEGISVDAKAFVKNVKDASPYHVAFKEKIPFDKAGTYDVTILVKDDYQNEASKKTSLTILPKDTTPPIIEGVSEIRVVAGTSFQPLDFIHVHDNQDSNPQIEIVTNTVHMDQTGSYDITYLAKDRSGNQQTFQQKVDVIPATTIGNEHPSKDNIVYLTFDDGPSENTAAILDILKKYQVKATFFVTKAGETYPQLIQRAHQEGHTIGLHTYSHNYEEIYQNEAAYFADLFKVDQMVFDIIGVHSPYIRFPGGSSNTVSTQYNKGIMTRLAKQVITHGYQYYDWNVSSGDASGNNVATDTLIANSTQDTSGNLNLLFHDTSVKDTTVEALPRIIEHYQALGFRFEAIQNDSYTCHHGINN